MKQVEIITHCWAEKYKHYASALWYQLSSFILHAPTQCEVIPTVCYVQSDMLVRSVLEKFEGKINIKHVMLDDADHVGRRSIGRNIAANSTTADYVWFTDADYVFGEGCLDALATTPWNEQAIMAYPSIVLINNDHAIGDAVLGRVNFQDIMDVDPTEYKPIECYKAIGGMQIVEGKTARANGYLGHSRFFQKPTGNPFGRKLRLDGTPSTHTPEDIIYRDYLRKTGRVLPMELPQVYRIRHSG